VFLNYPQTAEAFPQLMKKIAVLFLKNFPYRIQGNPPLNPILSQMNPLNILTPCVFKKNVPYYYIPNHAYEEPG
jgi:hypothetical protein